MLLRICSAQVVRAMATVPYVVTSASKVVKLEKQTFRLSQLVANTGLCSRNEAEKWIQDGRVTVNNEETRTPALKIIESDVIYLDGDKISSKLRNKVASTPMKIWIVNKLSGELVDDKDPLKNRPLMMQRLKKLIPIASVTQGPSPLKPISRMDFNSEGLCLVTTNSVLARTLALSKLPRYYRARIHGLVTESKLEGLRTGIYIDGKKQPPIKVKVERTSGTISWVKVETAESNSRAIKDCFLQVHWNITRMISVGFGPYRLDKLAPGGVKEVKLTADIVALVRGETKR